MQLDILPTDTFKQFKIRRGFFRLNGSSIVPGGVNFAYIQPVLQVVN